jgi:heat shock protein HtpX
MHRNAIKTAALLAGLAGLLIVAGRLLGGAGGAIVGFGLGLALVAGSYWGSDRLAIRAARAAPLEDPRYRWVHDDLAELAARAEMVAPRLYLIPASEPNAFATGRNERTAVVAVTAGLLEQLDRDEVRAVLAHELGHVRNRDILIVSIAAAVATGISMIANLAMWSSLLGGTSDDDEGPGPIGILLAALVAPIAATLLQLAVSRSREFEADRTAAALLGTGEPLARALRRIADMARRSAMAVNPTLASAYIINPLAGRTTSFAQLFQTHPATEQRVARLLAPIPARAR